MELIEFIASGTTPEAVIQFRPSESTQQRVSELIERKRDGLLRLKGVLHTAGDPRPLVIHGVQRLFHAPLRLDRWMRAPATSIVAIGDKGARPAIEMIAEALAGSACAEPTGPVRQPPALAHAVGGSWMA